jgi:uncharacterized membrane protein
MMSHLIVITFDNPDDAGKALKSLRQIEKSGHLHLIDTAVIVKDAEGKTHVKNEVSSGTETGAVVGGLLGPFLFFAFPLAGIAVGAGAGALIGKLFDTGVDQKFVKDVRDALQPNHSALFLVGDKGDPNAVLAALRPYKGEVYQTTFDPEVEKQLREALK